MQLFPMNNFVIVLQLGSTEGAKLAFGNVLQISEAQPPHYARSTYVFVSASKPKSIKPNRGMNPTMTTASSFSRPRDPTRREQGHALKRLDNFYIEGSYIVRNRGQPSKTNDDSVMIDHLASALSSSASCSSTSPFHDATFDRRWSLSTMSTLVLMITLIAVPVQPFLLPTITITSSRTTSKIRSFLIGQKQTKTTVVMNRFSLATTTRSFSATTSSLAPLSATTSPSSFADDSSTVDARSSSQSSASSNITSAASTNDEHDDPNNKNDESLQRHLKVAFVTGNSMKTREVNAILVDHAAASSQTTSNNNNKKKNNVDDPFQYVVDLRVVQVDLPEIQEVDTLAIAKHKAQLASQLVGGGPCVIEDTALQFTALGGMPGPYIKWFQESLQCEGLYKILQGYEDKSATAVCTLAFCPSPHADPILFTGEVRGTIVAPVPGRGFGWDGIFVPEGEDLPFSCMTTEQKNAKSHRGKAVRQWAEWMQRNRQELWQRQEYGSKQRPMIGHKGMDFTIYSPEQ